MKKALFLLSVLFLSSALYAQNKVEITLKSGTQAEIQTKEQLQRLLRVYDLSKMMFTNAILIDEKSIPHSHPTLTLHTRHLKDDELLLSTFVHEQFHWFLVQNSQQTAAAVKDLRRLFPKVPTGYPAGADDEESTYLHLLVCYLEYRADEELLGELKAGQVMNFWSNDHYTWVYKIVVERQRDIFNIMSKYKLLAPAVSTDGRAQKIGGASEMESEKKTFIAIYKPGAAWIAGKPVTEQPLKEHGKFLLELYKSKILLYAGPFGDDTGGAAVIEVSNAEEAKKIVERDPAVTGKVMIYEIHPWKLVPWEKYAKK